MQYINHNGAITTADNSALPNDNKAFRYGYGLFETMLLQDERIRLGAYHWERLFAGMEALGIDKASYITAQWLEEQVLTTARKNNAEKLCRIRLQVYAGTGGIYDAPTPAGFIIECFLLEEAALQLNENGLVVGRAIGMEKSMNSLANLKSSNALIYAIAARKAKDNQWNDALIANTNGHIIESTIANIFWVKNDVVYTPPLSAGCVAGVMRRHWLAVLPLQGIPVHETDCTDLALATADEVFLTNAIKPIRWVSGIGDVVYGSAKARQIFGLIQQ